MTIDQLRDLLTTMRAAQLTLATTEEDELLFVRSDLHHAIERLERVIQRKATERPPMDGQF